MRGRKTTRRATTTTTTTTCYETEHGDALRIEGHQGSMFVYIGSTPPNNSRQRRSTTALSGHAELCTQPALHGTTLPPPRYSFHGYLTATLWCSNVLSTLLVSAALISPLINATLLRQHHASLGHGGRTHRLADADQLAHDVDLRPDRRRPQVAYVERAADTAGRPDLGELRARRRATQRPQAHRRAGQVVESHGDGAAVHVASPVGVLVGDRQPVGEGGARLHGRCDCAPVLVYFSAVELAGRSVTVRWVGKGCYFVLKAVHVSYPAVENDL